MKLCLNDLKNKDIWNNAGFILPKFDIEKVRENTYNKPFWVHFGAGNLFRSFPSVVCQKLLNKGIMDRGIIVAEGYDTEIIDKIFSKFDNLSLCVTLESDGNMKKEVIASVTEALKADFSHKADTQRLKDIFAYPGLEIVSFTITEKGYSIKSSDGNYLPEIQTDFNNSPDNAKTYMGRLAALCYHRFLTAKAPLTLVSMDNCSHNGTRLKEAVTAFGEKWSNNGFTSTEFYEYTKNNLSYPWTMIDKITPRPSEQVSIELEKNGFENAKPIVTEKNTFTAAFVNAEAPEYLVIEDSFKNGKPPLDKGGIIYTDKKTVDMVEKMKVCTCLNPLHTALAVFGCLLGYDKICDEMKNKHLVSLIKHIGYDEGLPVVTNPKIIEPKAFIDEVINVRLPNHFIPDTPWRIACDTSQKVGIRFGETIKAYDDKAHGLKYIPLTLAGWCRYLMAVDDEGNSFTPSPDPLLNELTEIMSSVKLGNNDNVTGTLAQILSRKDIFGVNLYNVGLGDKIEQYFIELNGGKGAVSNTLKKYCM